jgi:hypothetical protein
MVAKALKIVRVPNAPHYEVRWEGGGEVPAILQGTFTSVMDAMNHITVWEDTREKDEPVEVKDLTADIPMEKRRGRPPTMRPIEG